MTKGIVLPIWIQKRNRTHLPVVVGEVASKRGELSRTRNFTTFPINWTSIGLDSDSASEIDGSLRCNQPHKWITKNFITQRNRPTTTMLRWRNFNSGAHPWWSHQMVLRRCWITEEIALWSSRSQDSMFLLTPNSLLAPHLRNRILVVRWRFFTRFRIM